MSERYFDPTLKCEPGTVEDTVYIALVNAEEGLRVGLARFCHQDLDPPYSVSDVVALAVPLLRDMLRAKGRDYLKPGPNNAR